ncbi:tropomyosin-like [Montipora capricornis]|uniref:tropomyosin-like n=1 Tax=Montipora capricornis TaxID=246305 RepID=UPI0035F18349
MSVNSLPVSNVKRKLKNRTPSGNTRYSPEEKRSRVRKITEEERHESDNGVEALQEVHEHDKMEKSIETVVQISAKLNILDEIERKMNKLDSIEEKMEKFLSRLDDIEKSISLLRCEVNSSKEKQAEIKRFVDEVKDSVDYAHARTDALELKSYKLDVDLKEAKEDLRKKIIFLETYSRRENLKFAGIPEVNSDQEDTKNVLTNFISRQLGIENPEDIEFQRVHRIGKKGDRPRTFCGMLTEKELWETLTN